MLQPALALEEPVRIVCMEGKLEGLLAELAVHHLDLVLSDRPAPPGLSIRAYSHALGESGISFFAGAGAARKLRRGFPGSLHEAPVEANLHRPLVRFRLEYDVDTVRGRTPVTVDDFQDRGRQVSHAYLAIV